MTIAEYGELNRLSNNVEIKDLGDQYHAEDLSLRFKRLFFYVNHFRNETFVKMYLFVQNLDIIPIKIMTIFQTMLGNDRILVRIPSNMAFMLLNSDF